MPGMLIKSTRIVAIIIQAVLPVSRVGVDIEVSSVVIMILSFYLKNEY